MVIFVANLTCPNSSWLKPISSPFSSTLILLRRKSREQRSRHPFNAPSQHSPSPTDQPTNQLTSINRRNFRCKSESRCWDCVLLREQPLFGWPTFSSGSSWRSSCSWQPTRCKFLRNHTHTHTQRVNWQRRYIFSLRYEHHTVDVQTQSHQAKSAFYCCLGRH